MNSFQPNLSILPEAQRNIWPKLNQIHPCFTLYGGTAIALQLGHRISVDFDFFSNRSFLSDEIISQLSSTFLVQEILQAGKNTLTCSIQSNEENILFSFFGDLGVGSLKKTVVSSSNDLRIASLDDLFIMKLKAILGRVEEKDFIDIAALLRAGYKIEEALAGFAVIFPSLASPTILLRTLSYLEDERLSQLTTADIKQILNAVSNCKELPIINLYQTSITS